MVPQIIYSSISRDDTARNDAAGVVMVKTHLTQHNVEVKVQSLVLLALLASLIKFLFESL